VQVCYHTAVLEPSSRAGVECLKTGSSYKGLSQRRQAVSKQLLSTRHLIKAWKKPGRNSLRCRLTLCHDISQRELQLVHNTENLVLSNRACSVCLQYRHFNLKLLLHLRKQCNRWHNTNDTKNSCISTHVPGFTLLIFISSWSVSLLLTRGGLPCC
jgi:hypothetical protein